MAEETKEVIDPKNVLIEVKSEEVVDKFTINDLEEQIARIDGQINNIRIASEAEIATLEAEKLTYRDKIQANSYEGYLMPSYKFVEPIKVEEPKEVVIEELKAE